MVVDPVVEVVDPVVEVVDPVVEAVVHYLIQTEDNQKFHLCRLFQID
jgi:hypothetical protein